MHFLIYPFMLSLQATPKAPMAVVDESPQWKRTSTGGGSRGTAIQVTPYDVYRCYYTYICDYNVYMC